MQERPAPAPFVRFGVYMVDLRAGELHKNGYRIRLSEQPFQILSLLLERPGEVVTRDEIRHRLWPADTFVDFDHGLNNAIKKLRDVLEDSAEHPRFVETLPRRGYRFIHPVEHAAESSEGASLQTAQPLPWWLRRWVVATLGVVAVAFVLVTVNVGGLRDRLLGRPLPGEIRAIAVLPLENLTGDPQQEYLVDGVHDELITELAQVASLSVPSRTTVMQYKQQKKSMAEIARELKVDAVVEGAIKRTEHGLRLTVQLIHAPTDQHLWAASFERNREEQAILPIAAARAIVGQLYIQLTPQERERLTRLRPVHPEAYEVYLKGRYYSNIGRPWATLKAVEYFEQAVEIDPNFALAYAALGRSASYRRGSMPTAMTAALRALELDRTLGEAHTALGMVQTYWLWDWATAERCFQRGIEVDRSNAIAHHEYALYLTAMGRFDEAISESKLALSLDPVSRVIATELGRIYYRARRNDEAIEAYQKALEIDPNNHYPHLFMGFAYEQKGMYDKAREKFLRAAGIVGENTFASTLAKGYDAGGYRGSRLATVRSGLILLQEGKVGHSALAIAYAGLGRANEAVDMLEKAYAKRESGLVFLGVEPAFDPIRDDPRFQAFLRRVGLPPKAKQETSQSCTY